MGHADDQVAEGGDARSGPPGLSEPSAQERALLFSVFQEIGIIEHLARHKFEAVMPDDLLVPHFSVLNHLARLGDDKSLKLLAFAFQVSKGTMTNTVQRLEARGYVCVAPDPSDGRGKRVFLTERGRAVRDQAIANITPELLTVASAVGLKEFAALLPTLQRLRAVLDEMRNVDKPAPTPGHGSAAS